LIYICKRCWTDLVTWNDIEFASDFYVCEVCGKSEIVEVDDLCANTVILLNKNGRTTDYCCEGHCYNNGVVDCAYISFTDTVPLFLINIINNLKEYELDDCEIDLNESSVGLSPGKLITEWMSKKDITLEERMIFRQDFNAWKTKLWINLENELDDYFKRN